MGMLLRLLMSSGKGKWIAIVIILFMVFAGGSGLGDFIGLGTNSYQSNYQSSQTTSSVSDQDEEFVSKVFGSTEDFWKQTFADEGLTYTPATLVLYDGQTPTSGCDIGSAQAGPFYCPADQKVYIDLSFYRDLTTKYNAAGDFAMATPSQAIFKITKQARVLEPVFSCLNQPFWI